MIKNYFINDKFFLITEIVACITGFSYAIISAFSSIFTIEDTITLTITTICTLSLYVSYIKHNKNVMKALMGTLLGIQIVMNTYGITNYTATYDKVFAWLYLSLTIALFITHLQINSDHHSNPTLIRINQIFLIVLVLTGLIWDIIWIPTCESAIDLFFLLLSFLACSTRCAVIVCVESRLDAYKLDREAAGWSEETGYPKGYIHQKDR